MMLQVLDVLHQSFEENSVVWILISLGLGGAITAFIKFMFEQTIPELQRKRATIIAIQKYSFPLLRAADSLDRNIDLMLRFADKKWFNDPNKTYYHLSTLYVFGCYFGWCKILENEAFLDFEGNRRSLFSEKAKNFDIHFYRVFKGITGYYYFTDLEEKDIPLVDRESATVPRFALTAIGELMIKETEETNKVLTRVIGFVEFTKKYNTCNDFKEWFSYLENLLSKLSNANDNGKKTNANWNRLVVFHTNLLILINFLDPKSKHVKLRKIRCLNDLHPKVRKRLFEEIVESGYKNIIEEKQQSMHYKSDEMLRKLFKMK